MFLQHDGCSPAARPRAAQVVSEPASGEQKGNGRRPGAERRSANSVPRPPRMPEPVPGRSPDLRVACLHMPSAMPSHAYAQWRLIAAMTRLPLRGQCRPCCANSAPASRFIPFAFAVGTPGTGATVADGTRSGQFMHLVPHCPVRARKGADKQITPFCKRGDVVIGPSKRGQDNGQPRN